MNLARFGVGEGQNRRKTLVILGAGATRGASFVADRAAPLPPLDLDFFQQLSRMRKTAASERLLAFVREEFGTEVQLSMEQFFSEADYTDRFHREFNVDRGPTVKRYRKALDDFLLALPALLQETTWGDCAYHEHLASLLHGDDSIITFNYDLLIDRALRSQAFKKWDPEKAAYGFVPEAGADLWRDHSSGKAIKGTIQLLKMHGSANWTRTVNGIALNEGAKAGDSLGAVIIPPTWFKSLHDSPYDQIWKNARKEVRAARIIVVIGYSVPPTDLFSRSLLKVEAGSKEKREKLDLLVLVNPDRSARRSFVELVRGGLERTTRILEFDHLSDLSSLFRRHAPALELGPETVRVSDPLEAEVLARVARTLVGKLTSRERKVLALLDDRDGSAVATVEEVSGLMGIPEDEVRRIHDLATERLELIVHGVGAV